MKKRDLFTEDELTQMHKDDIDALKRAVILGVPTSIITTIVGLIIGAWLGWL